MWTSADFERWHPGIASAVLEPLSSYVVGPVASVRELAPFVLPAQRPASPEIAESPRETTAGDEADAAMCGTTPGPIVACAIADPGAQASAAAIATSTLP